MKKAFIFNIQKFSIHDGQGIRTVIFLKGCPLRCLWCANPESQEMQPQISVIRTNCIGCGACMQACQNEAISFGEKGVEIDRSRCRRCGLCARECYTRTLRVMGKEMTVEEVFQKIAEDSVFYKHSGGGYTLSGGEPLLQGEFCLELADRCAKAGFRGAMETSGFGNLACLKKLSRKLDLIFFDIKHMDDQRHRELTGVSNTVILRNLEEIQEDAKEIVIRIPVIPGLNDTIENISATARLCVGLKKVKTLELLPYHKLGEYKYESLGKKYTLAETVQPKREQILKLTQIADAIMQRAGKQCIRNTSALA